MTVSVKLEYIPMLNRPLLQVSFYLGPARSRRRSAADRSRAVFVMYSYSPDGKDCSKRARVLLTAEQLALPPDRLDTALAPFTSMR